MKGKFLLAGAALVMLAGLALWSGGRKSALAEVAAANDALRGRIAEAKGPGERGATPAGRLAGDLRRQSFVPGSIPWERVEEWLANERDRQASSRELALLRIALLDFTSDELMAELDRIDAIHGPDAARFLVGDILGTKDPRRMLDRFHAGLESMEGMRPWQIQAAFQNWIAREPEAAAGWFDEKIASGWLQTRALDGIRRNRIDYETILLAARPDDPAMAARLGRLPENERNHLFDTVPDHRVRAGTEVAWLHLIRDQLPADQQARVSTRIAGMMLRRDRDADIGSLLDEAGLDADVKQQVLQNLQPIKP